MGQRGNKKQLAGDQEPGFTECLGGGINLSQPILVSVFSDSQGTKVAMASFCVVSSLWDWTMDLVIDLEKTT